MTLFGVPDPIDTLELDFARWYSAYPKKRERQDAYKAYRAARRQHSELALLAARDAYLEEIEVEGTTMQYVVYPAGFLRRKVEDYLPEKPKPVRKVPACPKHGLGACFWSPGSGWIHA